jgi:transcriptional regulator with XRE-family HTH domain
VNLKGLIHRELGEGLREEELASAVGVSVRTIANILTRDAPERPSDLEKICAVFSHRCGFPAIRPATLRGLFELTENTQHTPIGQMRKVPLLRWDQIDQMVARRATSSHPR